MVYPSKVRFKGEKHRISIPFMELTAVTKEASLYSKKDAIKLVRGGTPDGKVRGKEYFFAAIDER